ncbi:MAG: ABC transporter ATP-binding protein [Armatimonadetes bacterium]|nr:ABC transporter ATP-binding protein [Armatimonadota bacterium]
MLKLNDIRVEFPGPGGAVRAVDGVSLEVHQSETLAIVGESGCGKTTLARCVLGLQHLAGGSIELLGEKVTGVHRGQAGRVGMVWQDPYASLDPRWKVGKCAMETLRLLGRTGKVDELFKEVGLDPIFEDRYPHQLSGGQRQRVAIARAIAPRPPLVICDEPTAALDLSVRAQILNLIKDLQRDLKCSFLYISHDLSTVRFLADRVAVMYLGRIVEIGPTEAIFKNPRHPYTQTLIDSAPTLERLMQLPEPQEGEVPDPRTKWVGCRFAGRCRFVQETCRTQDPSPRTEDGVTFECHFPLGAHISAR